ncbi:hypothetical protein ACFQO1_05210 [Jejudonia soesokkakensis]|uniref:Uncharacterized protein n=1 Tax=Jejudonia soesokkakensis TaxID=1323432 RepID=A0ABW2MU46_9FLAO
MKAEIVNQPYSGEFEERIYDIESVWNSQSWTWIKFTNEYGTQIVGQFRGYPKDVKVSNQRDEIIVLTSDYAFRLNASNLNIIETEDQPQYANLEVTPNGTFILSEFSDVCKLTNSLKDLKVIKSPFEMDMIDLKVGTGINYNLNVKKWEDGKDKKKWN